MIGRELIKTARDRAAERDLGIDYRVGDCEQLDLPDASVDVVSSTLGVMFAPDHEGVARELARVVRPGGRLALANWTPTSGIADMFKLMAPFQPPPPPSNPFEWGDEAIVRDLLGDSFELTFDRYDSPVEFPSGEAYWELFSTSDGPTKALADGLADRREDLHRSWVQFFEETTAPTVTSRTRASTSSFWASALTHSG